MYTLRLLCMIILVNHICFCPLTASEPALSFGYDADDDELQENDNRYGSEDFSDDDQFSSLHTSIAIEPAINGIKDQLAYLVTQDISTWQTTINGYIQETLPALQEAANTQNFFQVKHELGELLQILKTLQKQIQNWLASKNDFISAQRSLDEIQSYKGRILDRLNWSTTSLAALPAALQNLVAKYKTKIIEKIQTISISPALMGEEITKTIAYWRREKVGSKDPVDFGQKALVRFLDLLENNIAQFWAAATGDARSKALKDINEKIGSIGSTTIISQDERTMLQLLFGKTVECLETVKARISTFEQHIDSGIQYTLKGSRLDPNYGSRLLSELGEIPFPPDQALVYKNKIKGINAIENLIALYNHFKIVAVVCC